ncbi:MAG: FtsX-like permease family protein [Bacteroidales bacterium]
MKFEHFIASRMFLNNKANFSRPIVRLGVISVALGLSVMIISVSIVTGFQQQVREKVIGFGSHIQITSYELNSSYEGHPISVNQPFYPWPESIAGVRHIQVFANKAGIIKTNDQIEGIIFKGVSNDFDWSYFEKSLIFGKITRVVEENRTDDVIISKSTATRLGLSVGDDLRMYFINNDELQPRGRKFSITGIFETGLDEFDKLFVIGDIKHVQRLNGWTDDEITGFEVLINEYDNIDKMGEVVSNEIGYDLHSQTIKQLHPQIFEWLNLHDMNVAIIIALMVLVAGITMVSTLLILILEKTNMIGILKALGTKNKSVRQIFLYNATYIIGKGLIWGNVIAVSFTVLQLKFGLFKLNQESYYVSEVPVNFQLSHYLIINTGTLIVCTLMLIIPTYIVTRISPVKAIRFQ